MSRADAVLLAQDWLSGIGDLAFIEASYDEELRDLARRTGAFHGVVTLTGIAGVSTYEAPPATLRLDQVVWYPTEIPRVESQELDLTDPHWVDRQGTPQMWTEDDVNQNIFEVYPTPAVDGQVGGLQGHPIVLATVVPAESQVPPWVDGILAMRMAAREASRLGSTQDLALAEALTPVADALETMLVVGAVVDGAGEP